MNQSELEARLNWLKRKLDDKDFLMNELDHQIENHEMNKLMLIENMKSMSVFDGEKDLSDSMSVFSKELNESYRVVVEDIRGMEKDELRKELDGLNQNYINLKATIYQKLDDHKKSKNNRNELLKKNLDLSLSLSNSGTKSNDESIESLKKSLSETEDDINRIKIENSKIKEEISFFQKKLPKEDKIYYINLYENENNSLLESKSILNDTNSEIEIKIKSINALKNRNENLKEKSNKLDDNLSTIETNYNTLQDYYLELDEDLDVIDDEIDKVEYFIEVVMSNYLETRLRGEDEFTDNLEHDVYDLSLLLQKIEKEIITIKKTLIQKHKFKENIKSKKEQLLKIKLLKNLTKSLEKKNNEIVRQIEEKRKIIAIKKEFTKLTKRKFKIYFGYK